MTVPYHSCMHRLREAGVPGELYFVPAPPPPKHLQPEGASDKQRYSADRMDRLADFKSADYWCVDSSLHLRLAACLI